MLLLRIIAAIAGWSACVLGAAQAQPLAGPALVTVITLLHARTLADPLRQLRPVLVLGVVGTLLESAIIAAGAYLPHEAMRGTPFAPLWITALWINAAVLTQGLVAKSQPKREGEAPAEPYPPQRLSRSFALPALVGAIAAPTAYWGAERLHAIAIGWSTPAALASAAVYGAAIAPAALWLIRGPQSRLHPSPAPSSPESTHG